MGLLRDKIVGVGLVQSFILSQIITTKSRWVWKKDQTNFHN